MTNYSDKSLLDFLKDETNYISDNIGMDQDISTTLNNSSYYLQKQYLDTSFKIYDGNAFSFIDRNIYHTSLNGVRIQNMSRMFLILVNDLNVYDVIASNRAMRNLPLYRLKIVLIPVMFLKEDSENLSCTAMAPLFEHPLNINNFTIFPKEIISRNTDFYSYYILSDENNYNISHKYNEEIFSGISKNMPSSFSYNKLFYDEYYNIFSSTSPAYIVDYPADRYFKVRNDNKDIVVWDTNE
jgi:hypothetical protein